MASLLTLLDDLLIDYVFQPIVNLFDTEPLKAALASLQGSFIFFLCEAFCDYMNTTGKTSWVDIAVLTVVKGALLTMYVFLYQQVNRVLGTTTWAMSPYRMYPFVLIRYLILWGTITRAVAAISDPSLDNLFNAVYNITLTAFWYFCACSKPPPKPQKIWVTGEKAA